MKLEPRQPFDWSEGIRKSHGDPCVVATPHADIAIFRALAYTDTTDFGKNDDGRLVFRATEQALQNAKKHTGYAYVMKRAGFTPTSEGPDSMK